MAVEFDDDGGAVEPGNLGKDSFLESPLTTITVTNLSEIIADIPALEPTAKAYDSFVAKLPDAYKNHPLSRAEFKAWFDGLDFAEVSEALFENDVVEVPLYDDFGKKMAECTFGAHPDDPQRQPFLFHTSCFYYLADEAGYSQITYDNRGVVVLQLFSVDQEGANYSFNARLDMSEVKLIMSGLATGYTQHTESGFSHVSESVVPRMLITHESEEDVTYAELISSRENYPDTWEQRTLQKGAFNEDGSIVSLSWNFQTNILNLSMKELQQESDVNGGNFEEVTDDYPYPDDIPDLHPEDDLFASIKAFNTSLYQLSPEAAGVIASHSIEEIIEILNDASDTRITPEGVLHCEGFTDPDSDFSIFIDGEWRETEYIEPDDSLGIGVKLQLGLSGDVTRKCLINSVTFPGYKGDDFHLFISSDEAGRPVDFAFMRSDRYWQMVDQLDSLFQPGNHPDSNSIFSNN